MSGQRPTPKTDLAVTSLAQRSCSDIVEADFARTLERELAEAHKALGVCIAALSGGCCVCCEGFTCHSHQAIALAQAAISKGEAK